MVSEIDCLIFSKDRACQLDALLRSIWEYAPRLYSSITILARATTKEFADGYIPLWNEGIIGEDEFETQVRLWLERESRISFLVDDDLFFRPVGKLPGSRLNISLRLGENTDYCDTSKRGQLLPPSTYDPIAGWFDWEWRDGDGDFGYPISLDGNIYHASNLLDLLDFSFSNPTELEAGLASRADRFLPATMTAPLHSCLVSIPANRVTTSSHNPCSDNPALSAEVLNERFLAGERIDFLSMDFSGVRAAHQLVPYLWTR